MNSSDQYLLSDVNILTVASTTVNLILSLPTNSYVVWLIATGAKGTMVTEFFPLNLAVCEILLCWLSLCILLKNTVPSLKQLSRLSDGVLCGGRPILQCCICIEQFLAVVHPVLFLRYKPLRYKVAFSGVAWAVITGFSALYTFLVNTRHLVFLGECVVLISVMLFCYFSVFVALKRPRPGQRNTERDTNMKRRAFFIILVIIVSFVGTYLLWCVAITSQLSNWSSHDRLFTKVCTAITFASGFVQPLLYLYKSGKLRLSCVKACTG